MKWWLIFLIFFIVMIYLEYFVLKNVLFHNIINPELYNDPMIGGELNAPNVAAVANKSIVITGLCRNVAPKIRKHLACAKKLGAFFRNYKIVLFENDSSDDTRAIIDAASRENPNIILLQCPENVNCKLNEINLYKYGAFSDARINKMTDFRNRYLQFIKSHFSTFDFLVVQDWDIDGVINIPEIINSCALPFEWSCIVANGRQPIPGTCGLFTQMYDMMAYCPENSDLETCRLRQDNLFNCTKKIIVACLNDFRTKPYRVCSAFNGLAIYKLRHLIEGNVEYLPNWSCEHVALHAQLDNVYINPKLRMYVGFQGPRNLGQLFK